MQHKLIKDDVWCEKLIAHRGAHNNQAEHGRILTSNTIHYKSGYSKFCINAVIYFNVCGMYCVVRILYMVQ